MKLCMMNKLEGNSSTCDDFERTTANATASSPHPHVDASVASKLIDQLQASDSSTATTTTTVTTVEHCDVTSDNESQENACSTIVSPPASPVDMEDMDQHARSDVRHVNHHQQRAANDSLIESADFKSISCTHCASLTTSPSGVPSSLMSPLCDVTNKRLTVAREIISVIRRGKFDEFINILSSKPNVDVNTFVNGNTALHYCLLFGRDVSWCKQLVSKGANPNLSNMDGWHPIHLAAAYCQQPEMLAYLARCNSRHVV